MSEKHTDDAGFLNSAKEIVLIVLILVLIFYALSVTNNNDGQLLPMIAGKGCAVVMTGSMEPTLPVDAMIFVTESKSYRVGDIVVIQDGYNLVVHRLIRFEDGKAITKGDANNAEDPPIELSAIKGKVFGHIPGVGRVVNFVKTPLGNMIMMLAAAFMAISAFKRDSSADEDPEKTPEPEAAGKASREESTDAE